MSVTSRNFTESFVALTSSGEDFPNDASDAGEDDFTGRSADELAAAVKTLAELLALRDTVRDVHALRKQRRVSDREVNDICEERIAAYVEVGFDSSTSTELRAIAKKGRDTWNGGTVDV